MKVFFFSLLLVFIISCNDDTDDPDPVAIDGPKTITTSLVNTFPHDTSFFTEGLQIYKGELYEGTGLNGKSKLVQVDLPTGKIIRQLQLDEKYFGEGITILRDTVYQLTYQTNVAFAYTLRDFKKIKEFKVNHEGWGMTTNGKELIVSDGTSNLYFYEPGTFRLISTLPVTESGSLRSNINELEYIEGYVYANQWQADYILKIDPASGVVVGKADLSAITNRVKNNFPYAEFMNGIAYDDSTKKTYITGKNWPELYEVKFSQ